MEIISLTVVAVIVCLAFGYTFWPLFQPSVSSSEKTSSDESRLKISDEIARLLLEREQAYKNIMEIDLDREMGKLSDEDYQDMIGQARAEALEILRRLESKGVKEGMTPAHVSEEEAAEAATRTAHLAPVQGTSLSEMPSEATPTESAYENPLDARLEEEILQYRKVNTPGGS